MCSRQHRPVWLVGIWRPRKKNNTRCPLCALLGNMWPFIQGTSGWGSNATKCTAPAALLTKWEQNLDGINVANMNMKLKQPCSGGMHINTVKEYPQLNKVDPQLNKVDPQLLGGRPPAARWSIPHSPFVNANRGGGMLDDGIKCGKENKIGGRPPAVRWLISHSPFVNANRGGGMLGDGIKCGKENKIHGLKSLLTHCYLTQMHY